MSTISGLGAIIVIVLGLAAFFASLVQIALMVVRGGMLVILAGMLPMSAGHNERKMRHTWFEKCMAWLVAFILYKPAAAIVYATAFKLAGSDVFGGGDKLMSTITGLVLMVLALLALQALMLRLVTPMVGAMASGGKGGGAMAAGAIATMPTGAMRVHVAAAQTERAPWPGQQAAPDPRVRRSGWRSWPRGLERDQWLVLAKQRRCEVGGCARVGWREPRERGRGRCESGRRRCGRWRRCGGRRRGRWRRCRGIGRRTSGRRSGEQRLEAASQPRRRGARGGRRPSHRQGMRVQVEAAEPKVRAYGDSRKPQSAGLGQLGLIGTGLMFGGLIVVILAIGFFGIFAALIVGVISLMLLTLILHDRHGRTVLQRTSPCGSAGGGRAPLARTCTAAVPGPQPRGHVPPAGLGGALDAERGAPTPTTARSLCCTCPRPVATRSSRRRSLTVTRSSTRCRSTCGSRTRANRRVARRRAGPRRCARRVIETSPDSGARPAREVLVAHLDPTAPAAPPGHAARGRHNVPGRVGDGQGVRGADVQRDVARRGGKRRDEQQVARDLAARLPGLGAGSTGTGAGAARPLSASSLPRPWPTPIKPRRVADRRGLATARTVPSRLGDVGPAAAKAALGHYRHDGATSVTLVDDRPRRAARCSPRYFMRLLLPHREIARKRVDVAL